MDELRELIQLITHLPTFALWILLGFLFYKLAILGSVYGVIRLALNHLHSWATRERKVTVKGTFGGIHYEEYTGKLLEAQLKRLMGTSMFLSVENVRTLEKILDSFKEPR